MNTAAIYIDGINPTKEVIADALMYAVGTPLKAVGTANNFSHTWFFIRTREGVRRPNDLEMYLFR